MHPSECLDIDYEWEFRLCEALYKESKFRVVIHTNKFNLFSYLKCKKFTALNTLNYFEY